MHHLSCRHHMLPRPAFKSSVAIGLILAFTATLSASPRRPVRPPASTLRPADSVYFEGKLVRWSPTAPEKRQRLLRVGPWLIGPRTSDKPRDGRLNLYVVAPGKQRHSERLPEFDHNLVINALPKQEGAELEWDVYLAIVLDPKLQQDIRDERELILARQQSFTPGDLFEFGDIPGAAFLREFLKLEAVSDLEGFRRRDGSLPRLVLVPMRAMIKASAIPFESDSVQAQSLDSDVQAPGTKTQEPAIDNKKPPR